MRDRISVEVFFSSQFDYIYKLIALASTLLCIFLLLFVRCDFSNAMQQRRWCQLKDIFILFRRFVPLSLWYRLQFVIYSSLQTCISIVWWLVMINCLSIFHQPQFLRCILSWVSIWHVCVWFEFFMTIDNEAQTFLQFKAPNRDDLCYDYNERTLQYYKWW